jgi:hypothetical protein
MMEYMVYFVTVLGLLIRRAHLQRADMRHTNAGYGAIFWPLAFCGLVGVIVLQSLIAHMLESALVLVFLCVCSLFYYKAYWILPAGGANLDEELRTRLSENLSETELTILPSAQHG